jgi:hypothetical protein
MKPKCIMISILDHGGWEVCAQLRVAVEGVVLRVARRYKAHTYPLYCFLITQHSGLDVLVAIRMVQ